MRLDKSAFARQSFSSAADHQRDYACMSWRERGDVFRYLMQLNFGFTGKDWPRMDKTAFQVRKRE